MGSRRRTAAREKEIQADAPRDLNRIILRSNRISIEEAGDEKPDLEIGSLIRSADDRYTPIDEEVIRAYLDKKFQIERGADSRYSHWHLNIPQREKKERILNVVWVRGVWEELSKIPEDTVFVTFRDMKRWKLLISVSPYTRTFFYDPELFGRLDDRSLTDFNAKQIAQCPGVPQWAHEPCEADSGVFVLLAIEKWLRHKQLFVWKQDEANREAAVFRGDALRFLAEHFTLKLKGKPYTPPALEQGGQDTVIKPVIDVSPYRRDPKFTPPLSPMLMHVYMKYLLDGHSLHNFRVVNEPGPLSPDLTADQILAGFSNHADHFHVVYQQDNRWRLMVVLRTEKRHYDPAKEPQERGQFARDVEQLSFKDSREIDLPWPQADSEELSGDYVLLAVAHYRDQYTERVPFEEPPIVDMRLTLEDVKNFRPKMLADLESHYELLERRKSTRKQKRCSIA